MLGTIKNYFKGYNLLDVINQTVIVLIGTFIFFNPFPHTTSIKEICFYGSMFIFLFLVLSKKVKLGNPPLSLPLALFMIWVFIGLFFALDKSGSIHDFYSHLLRYIVLYYIMITFFTSKQHLVALSWIIIISTTIFSIGVLYYEYVIVGSSLATRLGGTLTEITVNRIGIITIFAILLAIRLLSTESYLYRKAVLVLSFFPLCTATFMTQTRSTVIAMFLSISIILYKRKKMLVIFYIVFLSVIFATPIKNRFIGKNILNNVRVKNYLVLFEIMKDYPIYGVGFGMGVYGKHIDYKKYNGRLVHNLRPKKVLEYPHSMLIDIAVRTGMVGLILFCYITFVFLKICWNSIRNGEEKFIKEWSLCIFSAFSMFLIIGFFEPVFLHMAEVVFFTILSMGTIVWRLNTDKQVE